MTKNDKILSFKDLLASINLLQQLSQKLQAQDRVQNSREPSVRLWRFLKSPLDNSFLKLLLHFIPLIARLRRDNLQQILRIKRCVKDLQPNSYHKSLR